MGFVPRDLEQNFLINDTSKNIEPKDLGVTKGFDTIADRISDWLF